MRKKLPVLVFLILLAKAGFPQQQATFSQYMFNGLAINPAYAGSHEVLDASLLVRYQNVGVPGAPNTQTFAAHSPLLNENIALGLLVVHDKIGVIDQLGLNVIYAYRLNFSSDKSKPRTLSFGIQGGFSSYNARYSDLTMYNSNDPAFTQDIKESRPNFGFGIYYYTKVLYAGISIPHLINNIFDHGKNLETILQPNPIMFNGGYVYTLTRAIKIKPSCLVKFINKAPVELDINSNISFDDVLWLGASYKVNNGIDLLTEIQLTNQLRIGYCYSVTTSRIRQVDNGSHEFLLNYRFRYPSADVLSPRHF